MEKNLTVFSQLARKEFVFPQTPVKSNRKQEVIIVADLASSPSLDGLSLLLTGQQVTETRNTLPCVVLSMRMSPQAHGFDHLVSSRWHCLGRVQNL